MTNSPSVKTILYASDLGGQTRPVFRHALAMAKQYNAKIVMLHVVEPIDESTKAIVSAYLSKSLTEEVQKEAMKKTLKDMKDRLGKFYHDEDSSGDYASLVQQVHVVAGKPSEEILRVAEDDHADMIIMGKSTRKVRGIRVMGSTARRVSRMSRIPVLVVPNY